MNINFVGKDHKRNFTEKAIQLSSYQQENPEYLSALYILSSNQEIYEKTTPYFNKDGFSIDTLLEEVDFSSGQYLMVALASNLFNGNTKVTPLDLIGTLGDGNFEVAINAIRIRRYGAYSLIM